MPKTIETVVYTFDELDEKAKEKAREWWRRLGLESDWYESTYEDAKTIGLEIDGFDCDRHKIEGHLTCTVGKCVSKIIANHGKDCDTYKLARDFYWHRHHKNAHPSDDFEHDLLECYLSMLRAEAEYMMSDECVDENIRCNEYDFTKDGKRF